MEFIRIVPFELNNFGVNKVVKLCTDFTNLILITKLRSPIQNKQLMFVQHVFASLCQCVNFKFVKQADLRQAIVKIWTFDGHLANMRS